MVTIVNPENSTGTKYQNRLNGADFLSVFDEFSDGVMAANTEGVILYYNKAMSHIDELKPREVMNKKITEVYHLTEDKSIIMRTLKSGTSIIDEPIYYRTRMGKFANTIHSTFPLIRDNQIIGVICFVRDYNVLAETIESMPVPKNIFGDDIFFDSIVGEDPELVRAVNSARMAANTPSPIMLYGETGTGKELFARAIHHHSTRSANKYTPINCAAIPENLLEGILFGTSKGAFTGALNKAGLFERTNGGTIFLDEINSMPVGLQSKILRVLQERKVRRVGALREVEIDVKIISSVNIDPYVAIKEGTLRSDLFYRLGVVFIPIVPLAKRTSDFELLISHFIKKHNKILNKNVICLSREVAELFRIYHWPGNVRELEHVIEGAMNVIGYEEVIRMHHLQSHFSNLTLKSPGLESGRVYPLTATENSPLELVTNTKRGELILRNAGISGGKDGLKTVGDTKKRHHGKASLEKDINSTIKEDGDAIHETMLKYHGNIARSAKNLGISRQLLYYKIKKYKLIRSDYLPQQPSIK